MATLPKLPRSNSITVGSTTPGPFDLDFRLFDTDGLTVFVNEVEREDFTISATFSDGYDDDATITFASNLSASDEVIIYGAMVADRENDLPAGGYSLVQTLDIELPRLAAMILEIQNLLERVPKAPSGNHGHLSPVADRAGKFLGFDQDGIFIAGTPAEVDGLVISDFAETILDDLTASAMLQTLGINATSTQINYLIGLTGNAQTQLNSLQSQVNGKQAAHGYLSDIAALSLAEGDILYFDGTDIVKLAKGTALQVLSMNAGATIPEWGEPPLGVGQTIQNVAGSRTVGTSYQNTTGRAIQASIAVNINSQVQVSVDNSTWLTVCSVGASVGESASCPIIPDDWYYRIASGGSIRQWLEMR